MRTCVSISCIAGLFLLFAASSQAAGITGLSITAGVAGGNTFTISDSMIQSMLNGNKASMSTNADGTLTVEGLSWSTPDWHLSLDAITFDPDPMISIVGGLTNLSGVTQDFFVQATIPIVPVGPSSRIGGSTALTYLDANLDAAGGLGNPTGGASAYAGLIDGIEVLGLLPSPALAPGSVGDVATAIDTAGLPGPSLAGPAGATSITVLNRFSLSASDQATYNSIFVVEPVPEPGTAALLALGLVAVGVKRRRY